MTNTKDMPEEVMVEFNDGDAKYGKYNTYDNVLFPDSTTKYIRADKYEALLKQNEIMREAMLNIRSDCFDDSEWAELVDKALEEVK